MNIIVVVVDLEEITDEVAFQEDKITELTKMNASKKLHHKSIMR